MRRRFTRVLLAIALAFVGVGAITVSPAYADTPCDTPVYAQSRFFTNTSAVKSRVAQFEAVTKAKVRIVVVDQNPYPDLDTYKRYLIDTCTGWGNKSVIHHNLFIIMAYIVDNGGIVDRDHSKTLLGYGDDYRAALDDQALTIRKSMSSGIIAGDVSRGIITGLDNAEQAVKAYGGVPTTYPTSQPRPTTPVTPQEPVDYSGFFAGLGLVVAVLAVLTGTFFFILFLMRSSRRRRNKETRLIEIREEAEVKLSELDARVSDDFRIRIDDLKLQLPDETDNAILKLDVEFGEAVQSAHALNDKLKPLVVKSFWAGPYVALTKQYEGLIKLIDAADSSGKRLIGSVEELEKAVQQATRDLQTLESDFQKLKNRIEDLQVKGYRLPDASADVEGLAALLQTARKEVDAKMPGQALDEIAKAKPLLTSLQKTIESGPQAHEQAQRDLKKLADTVKDARRDLKGVEGVSEQLARRFGDRAVEGLPVVSSLSTALAAAEAAHIIASSCASMELQQWEGARVSLTAAHASLKQCQSGVATIAARQDELEKLPRSVASDIKDAISAAKAASKKTKARRGEQGEYPAAFTALVEQLDGLSKDERDLLDTRDKLSVLTTRIAEVDQESRAVHDEVIAEERRLEEERLAEIRRVKAAKERAEREAREERNRPVAVTTVVYTPTPSYTPPLSHDPSPAPNYGGGDGGGL